MPRGRISTAFRLLLAGVISCGLCQCVSPDPIALAGVGISEKNVTYTPRNWPLACHADLYKPSGNTHPAPVVILIHGGGWLGPDLRWHMTGIARRLSARGYHVMNITYRTPPDWRYPAPVEDVDAAMEWIRRHGHERGIDPGRIGLYGYSAGGHLALLAGLRDPRVGAIVAGAAPGDLMPFEGGRLIEAFIGGTRKELPAVYRAASPAWLVTRGSPPVFLYHGANDSLIPPVHARMTGSALERAGVPHEVVILEHRNHVTGLLAGAEGESRAFDFLDRYLRDRPRSSRADPPRAPADLPRRGASPAGHAGSHPARPVSTR